MYRVCVNPLKRSFGGKNPLRRVLIPGAFKRAAKGKDKTRKPMQPIPLQKKPLRSQVSELTDIVAKTMKERDAMRAYAIKSKNKTRKQLQRILLPRLKALEKQVSGYMRINSDLIAENEALRAYITRLLS